MNRNNYNLIISKTPLRVSFFGGGTDIPYFYNSEFGQTISVAIDKYVYVIIKSHNNYDEKYRINYSKTENVNQLSKMKNKRVKEILKHFKINKPLYVNTISDIPANTGLGSSSAFTVGLINAILKLKDIKLSKEKIAELAFKIESKSLKEDLGKQDQYISAFGNAQHFIYNKNKVKKKKLINYKKNIKYILKNSLLIFTNQKRLSKKILNQQKKNYKKNLFLLREIKKKVDKFKLILKGKNVDLKQIGSLLSSSWNLKINLSKKISNVSINRLYQNLIYDGSFGGKLLGAGNGGFLFMIMDKKTKSKIINKYKKKYKIFEPNLSKNGSEILR